MALSFDLLTLTIFIPQADLTLISGTLYELDTNTFRLEVIDAQDSEAGIPFKDVIRHNTEVVVAGITYARTIEIINGWSVEFEDGQYTVKLIGSNNNIFDVENGVLEQNQVQVISTNSAGLQVVTVGSGLSADQADQLLDIFRDLGLDPANPKTITEVVAESDFDEGVAGNTKEVRTAGSVTTLTTL